MMEFKLTQVRLLVTEYEACFFFYRDTLGFPVSYEDEDYASFRTYNTVVAIYKRPLMGEVIGTSDLPLEVESQDRVLLHFQVDNVDQAVEQLRAKGVVIVQKPTDRPTWGSRTAHFRDPDGTLIEISQGLV
jgi:lactoylglutathione lyase